MLLQIAACHLGKNAQTNMEDPSLAILPFVLIQGPPGTALQLPSVTVCQDVSTMNFMIVP